jgi:hypothetical protein
MKPIIYSIIFLFSLNTFAQSDTITAATAKKYIGKEVVLKGILKGVKPYSDRNGKDILFLDIDESYPNSEIGVTVFPDAVPEVKITKEQFNQDEWELEKCRETHKKLGRKWQEPYSKPLNKSYFYSKISQEKPI